MKTFLKSLSFYLLPVILFIAATEITLRLMPNDYRIKRAYLDLHSREIKALFLGNSHALYGINPAFIHVNGFNCAHVSQSINLDYDFLKKYDGKWDSLKYITLTVDYFSFYNQLEKDAESWRMKNYNLYHHLPLHYTLFNYTELLSGQFNSNVNRLFTFIVAPQKAVTISPLGWGTDYDAKHARDLIGTGKYSAGKHTATNKLHFADLTDSLKAILQFAKERNIKVFIITAPAAKPYTDNLSRSQLKETISTVTKIAAAYPNSSYINLLTSPDFTNSDFYDGDHLNEFGAEKLSLKIDSLIVISESAKSAFDSASIAP
jgi:hypothetical protein